jgi:hypothetical protein
MQNGAGDKPALFDYGFTKLASYKGSLLCNE